MTKNTKTKLSSGNKKFFKNPVFLILAFVFVAVGVFLTFNTFAANGPVTANSVSQKDRYGCPHNTQLRPTLVQGSSGPCVQRLQEDVNFILNEQSRQGGVYRVYNYWKCGVYTQSLSVDGQYGPNSVSAIRTIQIIGGIGVDGVVGQNTWNLVMGCTYNEAGLQ